MVQITENLWYFLLSSLFLASSKPKATVDLFADDEEEEGGDLFGTQPTVKKSLAKEEEKTEVEVEEKKEKPKKKVRIFDLNYSSSSCELTHVEVLPCLFCS